MCATSQKAGAAHGIRDQQRMIVMAQQALSFMLGTVAPLAVVGWLFLH
jgi:hypothetical protein